MRSRVSRGSHAIAYTALTIGILVLINVIAARQFARFDLTQQELYTIGEGSRELVSSLPDRLTVKIFVSKDVPPRVRLLGDYLRDMLLEYATYSAGKMDVEVIDPTASDKLKEEARRLKVPPIKLGDLSKTKRTVQLAYLGVAFQYGGKIESIPAVVSLDDLEYRVSSTIRRLTREKRTKVGFTSGHGEPPLERGLAVAKQTLQDYDVVAVALGDAKKPIPGDLDVLLMVGPEQPVSEHAKYQIDQFLMRGKALALLLDGMVLQTPRGNFGSQQQMRMAQANRIGMDEQLASYGVELAADLVMDQQNRPLPLVAGSGRAVLVNYPAFPLVTRFSRDNPMTQHLKKLLLVFPSSVALTKVATDSKGALEGTVLASTSANSWRHTGLFMFNPIQPPTPQQPYGPFDLAVYVKGRFKSFFAGKPVPTPSAAGKDTPVAVPATEPREKSPSSARLVVVGDSDFVKDSFYRVNPTNLQFLANVVDFLAQDESLIAIRAKKQTQSPLDLTAEAKVKLAKYGNTVGVPLALILFGLTHWRIRRINRSRRARQLLASRPPQPQSSGDQSTS